MSRIVLLAGGTGFIGTRLTALLRSKGYEVRLLTRRPRKAGEYAWDPVAGSIDEQAVLGAQVVINLAGAGIAERRWTTARKQLITDSRVESARVLRHTFQRLEHFPELYLSASAIGFYGNSGERWVDETDPSADASFLPQCCALWEGAAEEINALGIRTVVLRCGIVLGKEGGALREIVKPMRVGLGVYFADGQAWYSWIHLDDMCRMFVWAMEQPGLEGTFNGVAPHPVRNIDLTKAAAKALGRPVAMVPGPALALRLVLGEMADTVLFSNRVSDAKAIGAGFTFQYPEVAGALDAIFRKA
ncbi:MAG: TIGR01777 family protein [Saprospiraceae bacterium]|nr:TIGR01777 family protein [Saprospiraceae bacterium]